MADDASYTSFLSKANAPTGASSTPSQKQSDSTSQSRSAYDPTTTHASVPQPIRSLLSSNNPHYTSDTDSPFEPVFFSYSNDSLPSASDFSSCLSKSKSHSSAEVEELSAQDFDPRGEYKAVIDAVAQAGGGGKGDVKVYRVEVTKTRVEYYVMTVVEGGGKLVGVVTKAVES
jgi:hypothetical protein